MPKIFQIFSRAYSYAKNHKFLWFFGFFLTGGVALDLSRAANPERIALHAMRAWHFFHGRPVMFAAGVLGLLLSLTVVFALIGICRAALITATVRLERKEPITFRQIIRQSSKYAWSIAWISFLANAAIVVIFFWLFAPALYLISHGLDVRAFFLALAATLIFVPLVVALSLVNIFAACFVAVYNLHFKDAIKSSFDLIGRFWDRAAFLFFLMFVTYFLLFFISADILSLVGLLALGLAFLVKSLSIPFILGLLSAVIATVLILIIFLLLLLNAALNVFANISWTLFFLELVKANRLPEEPKAPVAAEPAM